VIVTCLINTEKDAVKYSSEEVKMFPIRGEDAIYRLKRES